MSKIKKKIIIVAGEPNSINSEIIYKSWKKTKKSIKEKIIVIGNLRLLKKQFLSLGYSIKLKNINNLEALSKNNELKIINVDLKFKNPFNINPQSSVSYVKKSLNLGHKLALNKKVSGLINCAISKGKIFKKNTGVTEYLANKCKIYDNSEVMMIKNSRFSVCPITTHLDLKDVSKNIKSKIIIAKINTIEKTFKKLFKKKPNIGVLGLNPHNAELKSGSEEVTEIIPAISALKKKNFNIKGPLVSDTVFINDYKNYDVIVGMYHDQILTPFKSIFKFDAINVTLGLKYLRTSPDHGVAYDLIKKNKANALSLINCINFINKF